MLRLLQQRTKLSARIGAMKRRTGLLIYVPERERELVARLTRKAGGLSTATIAAVYREIMSGSRAAQGMLPIGLLQEAASLTIPAARSFFGAADRFALHETGSELLHGLTKGALSLALLNAAELVETLRPERWRKSFGHELAVLGDFAPGPHLPLERRIFILGPRRPEAIADGQRLLILIECKSMANAIKSTLQAMPKRTFHMEHFASPNPNGAEFVLASLTTKSSKGADRLAEQIGHRLETAGAAWSTLGHYTGTEDYGG